MTTTTRTFKSGNSIAVRIPKEFALAEGATLEIKRRGKDLVLTERKKSLAGLVDILQSFPADFFAEGRVDLPLQERDFSAFDSPPRKPRKNVALAAAKAKGAIKKSRMGK